MPSLPKTKPAKFWLPNSTQIPNILLDKVIPEVSEAVTKVLLVVCRKTFGWQKTWDALSITQLTKLTGLSDRSVETAVTILVKSTLLQRGELTAYGWEYCMNVECDIEEALRLLRVKDRKPYEKKSKGPGGEINSGGGEKISPRNDFPGRGETNSQNPEMISPTKQTNTKPTIKTDVSPAATDTRRKDFIDDLKGYREHLTGAGTFQPTARDFKNLDAWMREHPKVDRELFRCCLNHRVQSVNAEQLNGAEEIYRWIARILEFSEGPLDRFNKPLDPSKGGNHGTNRPTEQEARRGTSAAVAAGVEKFLRGKARMGPEHVPGATAAEPGNPG
jgi:phage replication O-like protein O